MVRRVSNPIPLHRVRSPMTAAESEGPDAPNHQITAPEQALIGRARRGDVAAWSRLYEEAFDEVFRHVCFLTGSTDVAEDLAQDAFARAFVSIETFDQRSSFARWVRGIALNLVRMHWRHSAVEHRAHQALTLARSDTDQNRESDPSLRHETAACIHTLYALVQQLPEILRDVFILRDLDGLPTAEVAAVLGITPKNATVRATRARARLRDELLRLGWSTEESP